MTIFRKIANAGDYLFYRAYVWHLDEWSKNGAIHAAANNVALLTLLNIITVLNTLSFLFGEKYFNWWDLPKIEVVFLIILWLIACFGFFNRRYEKILSAYEKEEMTGKSKGTRNIWIYAWTTLLTLVGSIYLVV